MPALEAFSPISLTVTDPEHSADFEASPFGLLATATSPARSC